MSSPEKKSELREALYAGLPYLGQVVLFSIVTSILVLSPSWYMMEVYDRVINSMSYRTLLMLTLLLMGLYGVLETLEWVRAGVMRQAAEVFERRMRSRVFYVALAARLKHMPPGTSQQVTGDLQAIRAFLSSNVPLSVVDAPLALLVLVILFMMNPILGWFATAGALVQFLIGYFNESRIREPLLQANRDALGAQIYAGGILRHAQVIQSMGMLGSLRNRWLNRQREFLDRQAEASDTAGSNAAFSKLMQSLTSSLLLGVGCWLTLKGELSGSGMIVGSILGGRVLNPLAKVIANWRQMEGVRESYLRLDGLLKVFPAEEQKMALPAPMGSLSVEGVVAGPPGTQLKVLRGLTFNVAAGDSVAVVGPSASGKTTLARLLVGVWVPMAGKVRLDGSDIFDWNKEELGPFLGYLPQTVELFDGTIAENIARFGEPDGEKVREACAMVGLESLVSTFAKGYDTPVGEDGGFLSGGQRQRVALARAIYGRPKFVVLDEPNSNLDEEGDVALINTLKMLKKNGTTVIVMTHRTNVLAGIEYLMVLVEGQIPHFGPRDQVLAALHGNSASTASQPSSEG